MTEGTTVPPVKNSPTLIESAFAELTSGVAALCADSESGPVGMTLNSSAAVSLDPPLLRISATAKSATWLKLTQSARIGLNVLSRDPLTADTELSPSNAFPFFNRGWQANENGAVFLSDSPAWFECSMYTEFLLGDGGVALLRVHSLKL